MNTTQVYSFTRLALLIKRDFMQDWKKNASTLLGLYLTSLFIMVFSMFVSDSSFAATQLQTGFILFAIFNVWGYVYAASIMNVMNTKEKRISYLMLPTTNLEKFLARFLWVTIGFFLMVIIAIMVAEFTRFLLSFAVSGWEDYRKLSLAYFFQFFDLGSCMTEMHAALYGTPLKDLLPMVFSTSLLGCFLVLIGIWGYSLYILGGNIWYRHPFLKTAAILFILLYVILPVLSIFGLLQADPGNMIYWMKMLKDFDVNAMLAIFVGITAVLNVLTWWLSYHLFTRKQVIRIK